MNKPFEYLVNSRILTTYDTIDKELNLSKDKNYLFDLSYLGVLNITGEKALDFLQGQLTCDVRTISDTQMVQGAQCNLKGRILCLMDVIRWHGVQLILPSDLIDITHLSLAKVAQLSRVSIHEDKQFKIFGFYLQNRQDIVPDISFFTENLYGLTSDSNSCCYHLGNGFYIYIIETLNEEHFCKHFKIQNKFLGSLTWHTLRLHQKQLDIYPESRGLFLPHRLELHESNCISFDKGCYKGQEIIARTHYRATLKHDLRIYRIITDQKIYSGLKLINSIDGSEVAEIIDYSLFNKNEYLIAISILKNSVNTALIERSDELVTLLDP